jgi:hypothetical protein
MNHIRRVVSVLYILGGLAIIGLLVGPSVALAQQTPQPLGKSHQCR